MNKITHIEKGQCFNVSSLVLYAFATGYHGHLYLGQLGKFWPTSSLLYIWKQV